jgi:steroid 5-alpha reductase family enzyme
MPDLLQIILINLAVLLVLVTALWSVSVRIRDASIVDIFWGLGFIVVAWTTRDQLDAPAPESIVLPLAATLWGLRLAVFLALRNLGHGEDRRYAAMREQRPDSFNLWSLFAIFWLQGVLCLVISLPLQVGQWATRTTPGFTALEVIGLVVFAFGLTWQTVGDAQLSRFKASTHNRGKVMDRGLWRYSRHPNYFGEAVLWWGLWLVVAALPDTHWTVVGPLLITVLLLKVSGVSLLEKTIVDRRPAYADYIRRTNAFIPGPPR